MKIKNGYQLNAILELKNSCKLFKQLYQDQPVYLNKVNKISEECDKAIKELEKEKILL